MKPMLKGPGATRLTVKCDKLLSSFAFNFNLRRYTKASGAAASEVGTSNHFFRCVAITLVSFLELNFDRHVIIHVTERERDASACMRRHQASALAPVSSSTSYILVSFLESNGIV